MEYHSTYMGVSIYRNKKGIGFRWMAYNVNGWVYADTLAGIKRIIKKGSKYNDQ